MSILRRWPAMVVLAACAGSLVACAARGARTGVDGKPDPARSLSVPPAPVSSAPAAAPPAAAAPAPVHAATSLPPVIPAAAGPDHLYALLINGGGRRESNYQSH